MRGGSGFSQTQVAKPGGPVTVTLHDCLACSGCITSAETVLLEHQGLDELKAKLKEPGTSVVVSVSPQSRAALAAVYHLPPSQALRRLSGFFKSIGVKAVFDLGIARDLSLTETLHEFMERHRSGASASTSGAETGSSSRPLLSANGRTAMDVDELSAGPLPLPMLASSCPGWVCYAEKTLGDYVLPYISLAKSPQAMMGTLVKRLYCKAKNIPASELYHVTVMPCYDKKLEAARDDFLVPGTSTAEVDSSITSSEVHKLLQEHGMDLASAPDATLDTLVDGEASDGQLYGLPGGSGGYLEYVYRSAAKELFGVEVPQGPLQMKDIRKDLKEITLERDDQVLLKFAQAYGFRNIQTLVRRIKRGTCPYHFVEVMACPSGCLNGGGQPQPPSGKTASDVLQEVEAMYHHQDIIPRSPEDNRGVARLYANWVGAGPGSQEASRLFRTLYHKREKTLAASLGDW
eukprot:evm.model.scf_1048.1 EVM.evm.TU.scf_1048.1   scf_1048:215-6709(-)